MPTLGLPELVIILVIAMLVFGVGKLGDAGAAVGKAVKEFRGAMKDVQETAEEVKKEPVDGGGVAAKRAEPAEGSRAAAPVEEDHIGHGPPATQWRQVAGRAQG